MNLLRDGLIGLLVLLEMLVLSLHGLIGVLMFTVLLVVLISLGGAFYFAIAWLLSFVMQRVNPREREKWQIRAPHTIKASAALSLLSAFLIVTIVEDMQYRDMLKYGASQQTPRSAHRVYAGQVNEELRQYGQDPTPSNSYAKFHLSADDYNALFHALTTDSQLTCRKLDEPMPEEPDLIYCENKDEWLTTRIAFLSDRQHVYVIRP